MTTNSNDELELLMVMEEDFCRLTLVINGKRVSNEEALLS